MMFLWTYKTSSQNSKMEPCIRRMNRVVFVVASSPILLSAIIRTHLKEYEYEKPTTAARLWESLYLDNVIMSLPDVDLFISYLSTSKVHIVCCWNGAMEIDDQLLWPKNEMDKRPDWKPSRFSDGYGSMAMMTLCLTCGKCWIFWKGKRVLRGVFFKSHHVSLIQ